jgi:hypothetical protein
MRFTQNFVKITKNSNLRCHFAVAFDVSYFTICDWLEKPLSDELTKPKYLPHLMRLTNLTEAEIFKKEPA